MAFGSDKLGAYISSFVRYMSVSVQLKSMFLAGCKTCNYNLYFLQDRSIAVWDMQSPTEINLRRVLVGHRAAVNVVDFDEKYIVSASGDRTIKVTYIVCKNMNEPAHDKTYHEICVTRLSKEE